MSTLSFASEVNRSVAEVHAMLLDETFLAAFVEEQHPSSKSIRVDSSVERSELRWRVDLEGDLPLLVTRFVGKTAEISLTFDLRAERLRMSAHARREGFADASLLIRSSGDSATTIRIDGKVTVSGPLSSVAEVPARDHIIMPVLGEDLVPMLQRWPGS